MISMITNNPVHDAAQHDLDMAAWESKRPVCCECGEPITDEDFFDIYGNILCPECVRSFRRSTEDWEGEE